MTVPYEDFIARPLTPRSAHDQVEAWKRVRELLTVESNWCKESLALDENGENTVISGKPACSWCLMGAADKCGAQYAYLWSGAVPLDKSIGVFNDHADHVNVLGAIDTTVAWLEEQERSFQ